MIYNQQFDAKETQHSAFNINNKFSNKQPILTFDNKMNRLVVPLYCGTCRAYGCQCYIHDNGSKARLDLGADSSLLFPSGSNSETTSFTDNQNNVPDFLPSRNFTLQQTASTIRVPAPVTVPNEYQSLFANMSKFNEFQSKQGISSSSILYNYNNNSSINSNNTSNSSTNKDRFTTFTNDSSQMSSDSGSFTRPHSSNEKYNTPNILPKLDTTNTNVLLMQPNEMNRMFRSSVPTHQPLQVHKPTTYMNPTPSQSEMKYKYQQQQQQLANPMPYNNVHFLNNYFAQQQQQQQQQQLQQNQQTMLWQQAGFHHLPAPKQQIGNSFEQKYNPTEVDAAFSNVAKNNNMFYFNGSHNSASVRVNQDGNIEQFMKQYQQFDSSQSFSSNSSNFDSRFNEMRFIKPIERQSQHTSSKPKNIHFMPSSYQIKQQPVQLILNSYQVHDFDASRRATKPKALNTKHKSNNNSSGSPKGGQMFVANTSNRNKKFAAYETILYSNNKSSDETSTSSSLSSSPTPLLDQFSSPLYDQYNINNVSIVKSNSVSRNVKIIRPIRPVQSQILCRLGNNCRYKRENKCKYYHPINTSQRSGKYKNENIIDISDYSIDLNDTGLDMDDSFFDQSSDFKLSVKKSPREPTTEAGAKETTNDENQSKFDTNQESASNKKPSSKTDKKNNKSDSMYSSNSSLASLKRLNLNSSPDDKLQQQDQHIAAL